MFLLNLFYDTWENILIVCTVLGLISSSIAIISHLQSQSDSKHEPKMTWTITVFIIIIATIILCPIGYIHNNYNNLSNLIVYPTNEARLNYKLKNQVSISGDLVTKRDIIGMYYDKSNSSSGNNINHEESTSDNPIQNTNNSMHSAPEQDSNNNKTTTPETDSHNPNADDLNTNSGKPQTDNLENKTNPDQIENSGQSSEQSTPIPVDYSIKISYTIIPIDSQITDENMRIIATTSPKASTVILTVKPAVYDKTYNMHSSNQTDWFFKANFDTPGTYTITATAYFEDNTTKSDSFSITYPFY